MIPTRANGTSGVRAVPAERPGRADEPWALQVPEVSGDRIVGLNAFLDTDTLFPLFGLPSSLQN